MVSQRNDIQMLKRWNLGNMTKLLPKNRKGVGKTKTQRTVFEASRMRWLAPVICLRTHSGCILISTFSPSVPALSDKGEVGRGQMARTFPYISHCLAFLEQAVT